MRRIAVNGSLNEQYDARASVPNSETYLRRRRDWSDEARRRLEVVPDLRYGDGARNTLDLFHPAVGDPPWPVVVYVHGGYWRANSKEDSAYVAVPLAAAGIAAAIIEYPLLPASTMDRVVADVRLSVAWLVRQADRLGINPRRIFVAGHSSGAHLAAMLLASGWQRDHGLRADLIRSGYLLSGLFDLEPVRDTFVNEWARLDPAAAIRNSPVHDLPLPSTSVVIAYGSADPEGFQRQSRDYGAKCAAAGVPARTVELEGLNHYETPEILYHADHPLTAELLRATREGDARR